jgi:FMNH2-dependent dimethyl sulfone monooxygenase
VFGTVHTPMFNPVIAAKEMVTADHIGQGRFGLNIVVGWNEDEFEMFGVKQREHEQRYEYSQEWVDVIRDIWSDKLDFDFEGKYLTLKGVRAKPKPFCGTRPLIMNAGISPAGQAFAIRNCDAFFIQASRVSMQDTADRISKVEESARAVGRKLDFYTVGVVVCRKTKKEAEDYFRHAMVENADLSVIDIMLKKQNVSPASVGSEEYENRRRALAANMGGSPIIGDPDFVAEQLAGYSKAGLTGIAVSLINFLDDLPILRDEVLPRLRGAGLRQAME